MARWNAVTSLAASVALVLATACTVKIEDPAGRACDEAHPCAGGRVCVEGACVSSAAADAGTDGGLTCAEEGQSCTVGLGLCARTGEVLCEAGVARCSEEPGEAAQEVCDAEDNDCDGEIDEPADLLPPPCPLTQGVCAETANTCLGAAGWSGCDYGPDYESSEQLCDGKDNDCNGIADDVPGCLYTVAGDGPPGLRDGVGDAARLARPEFLTLGPDGLLYVPESANHTIRRVNLATGEITAFAGTGRCGNQDGPLATATLCGPVEVGFDAQGVLYFTQWEGRRLRKIENGVVTTVAGNGNYGNTDGNALTQASFRTPCGLDVLSDGDVLIADNAGHRIRRYNKAQNTVTTEAGSSSGLTDGTRLTMRLENPCDVVQASDGTLYVSEEGGDRIRKVPVAGNSSTLAGSTNSSSGYVEGVGTTARVDDPHQLLLDEPAGLLYFADAGNYRVRAVPLDGTSTTFPVVGGTSWGYRNGVGPQARLKELLGLARVGTTWYLSDAGNHVLRVAQQNADFASSTVDTLLGASPQFARDGAAHEAMLEDPDGLVRLPDGRFLWAEWPSGLIREVQPGGPVGSLSGVPYDLSYVNGNLAQARFRDPHDIVLGPDGALYVTDGNMHGVRKIDLVTGVVTAFAGPTGSSSSGSTNGSLSQARFQHPVGVAFGKHNGQDVMYVADEGNALVRKIPFPAGPVSTLAGIQGVRTQVDGPAGTGTFANLEAIWADDAGNVYVGDGRRLRRVDAAGTVDTLVTDALFSVRDIEADGAELVLSGNSTVARYDLGTGALVPVLSARWGWRDGAAAGGAEAFDLYGLWVTPEAYWLLDSPAGRLRRLWR